MEQSKEELEEIEEKAKQKELNQTRRKKMKETGRSVFKLADIIKEGAYERHETGEKSRKNP